MTVRPEWSYWVAIVIAVGAVVALFGPGKSDEAVPAAAAKRPPAAMIVHLEDARAAELNGLAQQVVFRSAEAIQEEAALDVPPRVVGVIRIGRRGFAYLESGDRSERLAIGQATGGWTLAAIGPNYADFNRAGQTTRVRLFTAQKAESRTQTPVGPSAVPMAGAQPAEPPVQPQ